MEGFAWAMTLQLQKKYTHKKVKTRLRPTKVNLIKDGKYERLSFPTHAINARLYLILTKKKPNHIYQYPCDNFASHFCLSEEVLKC